MPMKPKPRSLALFSSVVLMTSVSPAHAATVMTSDGFETSYGNWSPPSPADASVSLYSWAGDPAVNFATTGSGAVRLDTEAGTGKTLTLTSALALTTLEATYVTIDFEYEWGTMTSPAGTRFVDLQYSTNGGTNWTQGVRFASNASTTGTFTRSTGLTDEFLFRFLVKDDGNNANNDFSIYIDNVVITSDAVPEPKAALLGALGLLALLLRRR